MNEYETKYGKASYMSKNSERDCGLLAKHAITKPFLTMEELAQIQKLDGKQHLNNPLDIRMDILKMYGITPSESIPATTEVKTDITSSKFEITPSIITRITELVTEKKFQNDVQFAEHLASKKSDDGKTQMFGLSEILLLSSEYRKIDAKLNKKNLF